MGERTRESPSSPAAAGGSAEGVAEALLGEGWRVHFCGRSPEHVETARRGARAAASATRSPARRSTPASQEEVDRFVAGVLEREGRIDCLVNNAGLGIFGPVDELTGEQWREVIETNLSGYFYFLRAVAPGHEAGRGRGGSSTSPRWPARTRSRAARPTTPASSG